MPSQPYIGVPKMLKLPLTSTWNARQITNNKYLTRIQKCLDR